MPRPELRCCTATQMPFPSGWRWTHSRTCRVSPRQKARVYDLADEQPVEAAEPIGRGVPGGYSAARMWRSHPHDCICGVCRYVGAHMDDEVLT